MQKKAAKKRGERDALRELTATGNRETSWFRLQRWRSAIRFPAERSRHQTE